MKIVLISQNASPGFLIFRHDFIRHLVDQGHIVYCLAIDYLPNTKDFIENLGAIPVDYTFNKTGLNPLSDLWDTILLTKTLKKLSPDVVFSFFVKPSIFGTIAALFAGVSRRIVMLEGLGYIYTPSKSGMPSKKRFLQFLHGFLCSISYAFADEILFLNKDDPKDLSKKAWLSQRKLKVFGPIGLDLGVFSYVPAEITKPIRFIFIARLLAEKGIFEYIAAARLVKQQHPNAEFVVLGGFDSDNPSGISPAQLQRVINEGIIIYPGHVANVNEWLVSSQVFVMPSFYREGIPRSTQEAMAIGRAVITTDVPGCRETVIDGLNGYIVPPWNIEKLAEKMLCLISNPSEIKRMGNESYRIALERFDVKKKNAELEAILLGYNS